MVILGVLLILALCIYGVWRLSARSPSRRYGGSGIWRLAGLIATVRIGAIWLGIFGLQHSDWVSDRFRKFETSSPQATLRMGFRYVYQRSFVPDLDLQTRSEWRRF